MLRNNELSKGETLATGVYKLSDVEKGQKVTLAGGNVVCITEAINGPLSTETTVVVNTVVLEVGDTYFLITRRVLLPQSLLIRSRIVFTVLIACITDRPVPFRFRAAPIGERDNLGLRGEVQSRPILCRRCCERCTVYASWIECDYRLLAVRKISFSEHRAPLVLSRDHVLGLSSSVFRRPNCLPESEPWCATQELLNFISGIRLTPHRNLVARDRRLPSTVQSYQFGSTDPV